MKTDLAKAYKRYYTAPRDPELITLETLPYLSITGKGDPSGEEFARSVEALYTVAYALKFASKEKGADFVVPKLEGLWWCDETRYKDVSAEEAPGSIPRSEWEYRLMVRMPDAKLGDVFPSAKAQAFQKKKNPRIEHVEWFELSEGTCVQILHEGPFDQERVTISKIKSFMDERGLKRKGVHHEIYLSDFRKTSPEKLKTILREPVGSE